MNGDGGEIQPGTRKHSTDASFRATPAASSMPAWYPELLASGTRQGNTGRSKEISVANRELLAFYWSIGRELAQRETQEGWGVKVVTRLSEDVRSAFPDATEFSLRNLRYVKSFAQACRIPQCCNKLLQHCPQAIRTC